MEALLTGGIAGGLIAVALGAIKIAEHKMNSKPPNSSKFTSDDRSILTRIDRWTVSHDKIGEQSLEVAKEQMRLLRDMRDTMRDVCHTLEKR
jgi:hypothetical protein